jgi:hypothetical protein
MSVVKLQPTRIHSRGDDGSMTILAPRLPKIKLDISNNKGTSPLDFLRCCWESNAVPLDLRISAAQSALPFVLPRFAMIVPSNIPPQEIRILGGLPGLPGNSTILMPTVVPRPRTLADRDLGPEPEVEPLVAEAGFGPLDEPEASSPCQDASTFEALDDDVPAGF